MTTLIIPDIHENLPRLEKAIKLAEKAERVVQLGDWFDTFDPWDESRFHAVCDYIESLNWEKLLGNHDIHYLAASLAMYGCSGYDPRKRKIVQEIFKPDWIVENFKVYTKVGPYTLSHAGFHEDTLQYAKPEVCKEAMNAAMFRREYDPLFGAGRARGGALKVGGPIWLDWNYEFEHIDDFPQIVGHTKGRDVRQAGGGSEFNSYCLDTSLRHVAWVDEDTGKVEIEDI